MGDKAAPDPSGNRPVQSGGMERVKFLHAASSVLGPTWQDALAKELFSPKEIETLQVRLSGLSAQDELALVLFYLRCCDTIVSLEQGLTRALGDLVPADFLCNFNKSIGKAFLEAKTTQEDQIKISKADRQRRRAFSAIFGIPLYYTIKIRGIWGLFSDEIVERLDGLIKPKDFTLSSFETSANSYMVYFPAGTTIEKDYEVKTPEGPIRHSQYGSLTSFRISHNSASIHISDLHNDPKRIMPMALTPLQTWIGLKKEIKPDTGRTRVVESIPAPGLFVPLYAFMLSGVDLVQKQEGQAYDATRYLRDLQDGRTELMPRMVVEGVLSDLEQAGFLLLRVAATGRDADGKQGTPA
jgi:hypothetical protein